MRVVSQQYLGLIAFVVDKLGDRDSCSISVPELRKVIEATTHDEFRPKVNRLFDHLMKAGYQVTPPRITSNVVEYVISKASEEPERKHL